MKQMSTETFSSVAVLYGTREDVRYLCLNTTTTSFSRDLVKTTFITFKIAESKVSQESKVKYSFISGKKIKNKDDIIGSLSFCSFGYMIVT